MAGSRTLALALCLLVAAAAASPPRGRVRRQLADDNTLQPIEDAEGDEQTREKRKLEGITQAKFGIKNAVLGFVFGDGITSHRQARSTDESLRVSSLPTSSTTQDSSTRTHNSPTGLNTQTLRVMPISTVTPGLSAMQDTSKDTRTSSKTGTSLKTDTSSKTDTSLKAGTDRGVRQADDIPVFDRNKVSLDFPGSLFGPSLSLLIRTTKVVGDVIQNSAVRYQSFLRLFRPLFRGPFEIKGLDPPTTTTTTTTTAAPAVAENEVRRR